MDLHSSVDSSVGRALQHSKSMGSNPVEVPKFWGVNLQLLKLELPLQFTSSSSHWDFIKGASENYSHVWYWSPFAILSRSRLQDSARALISHICAVGRFVQFGVLNREEAMLIL